MKLYLMRHGDYHADDIQKQGTLTEQAISKLKTMVEFLAPLQLEADRILHSGKSRAAQTANIIANAFKVHSSARVCNFLNPHDDLAQLLGEITEETQDLLVVGHLPFLGRLASKLLIGDEDKEIISFEAGTLICLEQVERKRWLIKWMLSPSLFKF